MSHSQQSGEKPQRPPVQTLPAFKQRKAGLPALWIATIYFIVSLLWILLSDRFMFLMVHDPEALILVSNVKGYAFVFVSALLLWWLVYHPLNRMALLNRDLSVALHSEQVLGDELVRRNEEVESAHTQLVKKNQTLVQYQQEIRSMLYVDNLTGLPNRRALHKYLDQHVRREPAQPLVLMYLDLDNFKLVNDVHGHSQGDAYLREVAKLLRDNRNHGWRLFRMGGDEFVCCHAGEVEEDRVEGMAMRMRHICSAPVLVNGVSIHGSVSLGIARFPDHGTSTDDLLKHADIAMYGAKRAGRNLSLHYDTGMSDSVARRFALETALRTALELHEFQVVYQPQLDLHRNAIVGFEALLRWRNDTLGQVSPVEFIPVAEEARHILPIGLWVFQTACRFLSELNGKGYHDISLSVNVSMLQLLQYDFVQSFVETASQCGIAPSHIQLEITESILMQSRELVLPVLHALRSHGFSISLDDFGQGYSSLSYLMSMPIEVLKIDKRFIDAIGIPGPGESVLGTILELGQELNLRTVAEGVETESQRQFLHQKQCDCMQGYLFSRPIPASEAMALLESS